MRPPQKALNPVDEQKAISEGLRNGSMSILDVHGANWKRRLLEAARIKKAYQSLGIKYFPETDNNGMTSDEKNTNKEDENEEIQS